MKTAAIIVLVTLLSVPVALCQTETATISGRVTDPSAAVISGASVQIQNVLTGVEVATKTNTSGLYVAAALQPGTYRVIVSNPGFKQIVKPDVVLNVQDNASLNFTMTIGSASEIVTVTGGAPLVNTQDASVSTVVDRNFAENLPMNGRSFQSLIELAPGVVVTPSGAGDNGQFSVNGQRGAANYSMVDGVSANFGIGTYITGNGLGGTIGAFSVLGGTNSLVSVDALQEFRIQTSTYAPEFGRSPGAQISILTRSGTNQFHGTAFDYLRNDVLDASNWFNGYTNDPPLPKAMERQNDFGGTFGGPILRNKTFFFFSYEGLRLRLPTTSLGYVPDIAARQNASPGMQPYLNMYPLPNGTDNPATGAAQFSASYSNPATLNASSLRLDHRWNEKLNLFARYDYSPSELTSRGTGNFNALNVLNDNRITLQTATVGGDYTFSPTLTDELRFNFSSASARSSNRMDDFGGAIPLATAPFPNPYTTQDARLYIILLSLGVTQHGIEQEGLLSHNVQHQINVTDNVLWQRGSHLLKFGVDFRRLSPNSSPSQYAQLVIFNTVTDATNGEALGASVTSAVPITVLFRNLGAFAQDTWHVTPRLTLTYGFHWDVDFAPSSLRGPAIPSLIGYDLSNLSNLGFASAGTPPYRTTYGNIAPRFGLAYQIRESQEWQTVLRTGFGVYYDLASAETGDVVGETFPPFGNRAFFGNTTFPLTPNQAAPVTVPPNANLAEFDGFNPHLKLPYTLHWDLAVEQAVGSQQTLSISYIGTTGQRLLQQAQFSAPTSNPNVGFGLVVDNTASSNYEALQVQFKRRLFRGLQALASYTWSHSIDNASSSSYYNSGNLYVPGNNGNRSSSDFDIRHSLAVGTTYTPTIQGKGWKTAILGGWSLHNFALIRSAAPVDITDASFSQFANGILGDIRPDIVSGVPVHLSGPQYPGRKAFNPAAFVDPPFDPTTFLPLRQGDTPRNFLRGFGAVEWDLALHRQFSIGERVRLEFRAEMFNVVNHPDFGPPSGSYISPQFGGPSGFGLSTQTLNESLTDQQLGTNGAFNSQYQIGGPRSGQLALKLIF
jgi:hypothetical protein